MTPRADDDVYTSFMAILPAVDDNVQCVNMSCSMDKCVVGVGGGAGGLIGGGGLLVWGFWLPVGWRWWWLWF